MVLARFEVGREPVVGFGAGDTGAEVSMWPGDEGGVAAVLMINGLEGVAARSPGFAVSVYSAASEFVSLAGVVDSASSLAVSSSSSDLSRPIECGSR